MGSVDQWLIYQYTRIEILRSADAALRMTGMVLLCHSEPRRRRGEESHHLNLKRQPLRSLRLNKNNRRVRRECAKDAMRKEIPNHKSQTTNSKK